MEFRRTGQRDDRRRRVLMDEGPRGEQDATGDDASGKGPGKRERTGQRGPRYADAARPDQQLRVNDLIPTRPWTLLVLGLLGLTGVVGVVTSYLVAFQTSHLPQFVPLAPFDVAQRGSLTSCLTAFFLLAAGVTSVLIFLIRRHRVDDYRGRYRIWLPIAGLLTLASLDAGCNLHGCASELLASLASSETFQDPAQITVAFFGLLVSAVALRLVFEVRESRLALSALVATLGLFAAAGLSSVGPFSLGDSFLDQALRASLLLLAHGAIAAVATLYARHVHLEAQGLLVQRAAKEPRKRKSEPKADKTKARKTVKDGESSAAERKAKRGQSDLDQPKSPASIPISTAPAAKGAAPVSTRRMPDAGDEADDTDDADGDPNISRSERRRLKKMQRRGQQAA